MERSYIWTMCASVENGNPLFWDDAAAGEITDGPIAPPRCCRCGSAPITGPRDAPRQHLPLQVHFDLKERLGLPEAVMTDNTIVFHEPVRPGDVLTTRQILRSVSDEKTTKLGTGRFWVIDVEYTNQHGDTRRGRELHRVRLPARARRRSVVSALEPVLRVRRRGRG